MKAERKFFRSKQGPLYWHVLDEEIGGWMNFKTIFGAAFYYVGMIYRKLRKSAEGVG